VLAIIGTSGSNLLSLFQAGMHVHIPLCRDRSKIMSERNLSQHALKQSLPNPLPFLFQPARFPNIRMPLQMEVCRRVGCTKNAKRSIVKKINRFLPDFLNYSVRSWCKVHIFSPDRRAALLQLCQFCPHTKGFGSAQPQGNPGNLRLRRVGSPKNLISVISVRSFWDPLVQ